MEQQVETKRLKRTCARKYAHMHEYVGTSNEITSQSRLKRMCTINKYIPALYTGTNYGTTSRKKTKT
jgi:hypothetical protein